MAFNLGLCGEELFRLGAAQLLRSEDMRGATGPIPGPKCQS